MPQPTTGISVTFHAVTTVKTNCATKQQDIVFPVLILDLVFSVKMKVPLANQVCLNEHNCFIQIDSNKSTVYEIHFIILFATYFTFLLSNGLFLQSYGLKIDLMFYICCHFFEL